MASELSQVGEREQMVDRLAHAPHVRFEAAHSGIVDPSELQHDDGERRPELVGGPGDEQALRADEVADPVEQAIDGDREAGGLLRHPGNVETACRVERRHALRLCCRQAKGAERPAHRDHGNAKGQHDKRDHRHPHVVDDFRGQHAPEDAGRIADGGDLDPHVLAADLLPQAPGHMQLLLLAQVEQPEILGPGGAGPPRRKLGEHAAVVLGDDLSALVQDAEGVGRTVLADVLGGNATIPEREAMRARTHLVKQGAGLARDVALVEVLLVEVGASDDDRHLQEDGEHRGDRQPERDGTHQARLVDQSGRHLSLSTLSW